MLDEVEIIGTDISSDVLDIAQLNAVAHGVADRVRFVEADLVTPVVERPYDVVVANLPYVASADVDRLPVAASFEPRSALDGGRDGLDVVRRLVTRLPDVLAEDGTAFLEIGSNQGDATGDLVTTVLPGWAVRIELDLTGRPRVVRIERQRRG
jgi:HemK-like putative methylase